MDVIAGWYPDPEDPTHLRWWDGSMWTDNRQPLAPGVPDESVQAEPTEPVQGETMPQSADPEPTQAVEAQPTDPEPTQAIEAQPTDPEPTQAIETQATEPEPESDLTAKTTRRPMVPPPPPASSPGGPPPPPPPPPAAAPPANRPSGTGDRKSKKRPLIVVGVIAVLALVGAGAFFLLGGQDAPQYTWEGEEIADMQATLDSADQIFLDGAVERNGSTTDDSRCYAVQSADDEAEEPSDVFDFVRCGPVLFVDDNPDDGVWLTYALDAEEDDGAMVLTVAEQPQSDQPSGFNPDEEKMSRPDEATPPEDADSLEAPEAPHAEPGVFVAQNAALDNLQLESTNLRAVGLTKSVTVSGIGEPSRFGSGDTARIPAEGERFIAFDAYQGQGDEYYGTSTEQLERFTSSTATVSLVVDGDETVLYEGGTDDTETGRFLISVPKSAEVVDVVLVDDGVTQTLSLLEQKAGPDNITVLARDNRGVDLGQSKTFPVTITHPDGTVQQDTFTVTIEAAELLYYVDDAPDVRPSATDRAFLVIHHFVTSDATGITEADDIGLEPGHLHLETEGGVVAATNLAPNEGGLLVGFDVSGGFEGATLAINGAAVSGEINIDLGQPNFRVPIEIENG